MACVWLCFFCQSPLRSSKAAQQTSFTHAFRHPAYPGISLLKCHLVCTLPRGTSPVTASHPAEQQMPAEECETNKVHSADPAVSCHPSAEDCTCWAVGHLMRLPSHPGQVPGTGVLEKAPGMEGYFSPCLRPVLIQA